VTKQTYDPNPLKDTIAQASMIRLAADEDAIHDVIRQAGFDKDHVLKNPDQYELIVRANNGPLVDPTEIGASVKYRSSIVGIKKREPDFQV